LDQNFSLTIFRIYQETLTNVARHAKATKVISVLKRKPDTIYMEIKDNGIGITEKQVNSADSHGITGLRERVQHYRGHIKIKGTQNQGTAVIITIPLNNRKNHSYGVCNHQNRLKNMSKMRKIINNVPAVPREYIKEVGKC
jgi:glucose-6-phosphate-specific signal transduction histidine kinase